ncbi:MAG TPA: F0F1 ATP synthase subunit A [Kiritimatiellia bacterium]|jgi:F-type H+-transporting ATPase subunit a
MAAEQIDPSAAANSSQAVEEYVMHHVLDSHEWSLPFLHVHLPPFLSLHGLMLVIGATILVLLFSVLYRKRDPVPHGLTNCLEVLILFIRDQIAIPNLGDHHGRKLTPLFCTFFFFILCLNLMGLVPIFATATSTVSVTGPLALITLAFMIGGTIYLNGVGGFIKTFVPHGVPWPVLILLVPVEFLGMFIKAFALMIRLFANMIAGHLVILLLLGMVMTFGAWAAPAVGLAVGIYLLEIMVAFLQAYIFTLLSAMFMGQMYHPQH